ncbi:hypothetical protein RPC_1995 [Rhodopseudomonas palustris BisB18]|uniref:Secretion protein HlyD n=1 Tax=Rhodopseudomonas palustris (strain BisB18) TaxID=316056 RepID=Q216Y5_RHOPB
MSTRNRPQRRGYWPAICVGLLIGLALAANWVFEYLTVDQYLVSTDDAVVKTQDVGIVTPQSGTVRDVLVVDDQQVAAGQAVAKLELADDALERLRVQTACHDVGTAPSRALANSEPRRVITIVARSAGTVNINGLHIGQAVAAGAPLMSLVLPGPPYVIARLAVSQMTYVAKGQPVWIEIAALPNLQLTGHVVGLALRDGDDPGMFQNGDVASRSGDDGVVIKIVLDNNRGAAKLRSGMSVRSTIHTGLIGTGPPLATLLNRSAAAAHIQQGI